MVRLRDFERPVQEQDRLITHSVHFATQERDEIIKSVRSSSAIPVPQIGEEISLTNSTVSVGEEGAELVDEQTSSEEDGVFYEVQEVTHEYVSVSVDSDTAEDYRPGSGVLTLVILANPRED